MNIWLERKTAHYTHECGISCIAGMDGQITSFAAPGMWALSQGGSQNHMAVACHISRKRGS